MARHVIFNADDLGASEGINRGIVECHVRGVVTSASLMVTGPEAEEAVAMAREHPGLAVGLHFDASSHHATRIDVDDPRAVRRELERQLAAFERLAARPPTHLDSHHHLHRRDAARPAFREAARELGIPLREDGIKFVGGFFGQWEPGVTDLRHVSVDFLEWLLRHETQGEWTEIGCHPGYVSPGFHSEYLAEREAEIETLTDPRVAEVIDELGLTLSSFADVSR